jgi:hypothetical protein
VSREWLHRPHRLSSNEPSVGLTDAKKPKKPKVAGQKKEKKEVTKKKPPLPKLQREGLGEAARPVLDAVRVAVDEARHQQPLRAVLLRSPGGALLEGYGARRGNLGQHTVGDEYVREAGLALFTTLSCVYMKNIKMGHADVINRVTPGSECNPSRAYGIHQ